MTWDIDKAVKMKGEGATYQEIADEMGKSLFFVYKQISPLVGKRNHWSADREVKFDVDEAISLFNKGMNWRRIGITLGVHHFSIQNKLESLGYKGKKGYKKINDKLIEETLSLKKKGLTNKDISIRIGLSQTSIHRIIRKSESYEKHP